MTTLLSLLLYGSGIGLFFNCGNLFIFWILLELNMVLFILLFHGLLLEKGSGHLLYYFMIQCFGSFIFLLSFLLSGSLGWFGGYSVLIAILGVSLKLGLFPLYSWAFNFAAPLGSLGLTLFLGVQKIPLIFLLFFLSSPLVHSFLLCSLVAGSLLILATSRNFEVLISGSLYGTFWVLWLLNLDVSLFLTYMILYSFFLSLYTSHMGGNLCFYSGLAFIFFLGLPPLSMFFFKIFLSNLAGVCTIVDFSLLWLGTFLSLIGYYNVFYSGFFLSAPFYSNLNYLWVSSLFWVFCLGVLSAL